MSEGQLILPLRLITIVKRNVMTIKNRILYSSLILFALFLAMVTVNWFGNRSVTSKTDLAYLLEKQTMHLQAIFRGINEYIIDEGEPLSREFLNDYLKRFDESHNILIARHTNDEFRSSINDNISPQWKIVKEGTESFLKIKYISANNDDAMLQYGQLTTEAKKLLKEVDALALKSYEEAVKTAGITKKTVTIIAIIIMIMMAFILFSLYRSIISPIRELSTIAESFGNSDLSIHMDDSKKNEFGKLGVHFNHALDKLSTFIGKIKDDINRVAIISEKSAEEINKIASDAQSQSSQTSSAVAATEELSVTFTEIAQNTESVSNSARDAFNLAIESGDVVIQAMNSMNAIAEVVNDASQIVESLSHRSSQIGEIIKVIDEIADQTNLLALNANIEAARAGEQGRGFSVVANEVRKLAERTTSATKEITEMIKGIQEDTSKAVNSMKLCSNEVSSGSDLSLKAGNSLQQIVMAAQNVTEMIQRIAASVEEQSNATNEITSNLSMVANITEQTSMGAKNSSESSLQLHNMAMDLQALANEFRLRSDASYHNNAKGEMGHVNKAEA